MFFISLGYNPGVELLGQSGSTFLPEVNEGSSYSTVFSPNICYCLFLIVPIRWMWSGIFRFANQWFRFAFPWWLMVLSIFSWAYCPFVDLQKMSFQIFCPLLNLFSCLFYCWVVWVLCVLWILDPYQRYVMYIHFLPFCKFLFIFLMVSLKHTCF